MTAVDSPLVSLVIPTYNREAGLRETLAGLRRQTLPAARLQVCLVDDGASAAVAALAREPFPFAVQYMRTDHVGATAARNAGAAASQAEVLIFMDDDIHPAPGTLEVLAQACQALERTILIGILVAPEANKQSVFTRLNSALPYQAQAATQDYEVGPAGCLTGLLAVRRSDFFALGQFRDPTGGWPNWDDVDFGWRAVEAGFRLRRLAAARAEHIDHSLANLGALCLRWQRAGRSAARLLQRYPRLAPALPMFADKGPIHWRSDPPLLLVRKIARRFGSLPVVVTPMEWLAYWLEQRWPAESALRRLYRWIIGAYIFRGFQMGLKDVQCSTT
jgi:GT2 family glycosyltransferase